MDNLSVILGVDEKTIREELGEIKISKMVFSKVRELFDDDYDKFKKFYKYCKGNIPAMIYQFNEVYKSFEINIVNNDIPFMNEEDEKEIMKMIKEYHSNVNDSLTSIKKMLIELNSKNVEVDTKEIVDAYERETVLLQSIFKDIVDKLDSIENETNSNKTDTDNINNSHNNQYKNYMINMFKFIKNNPKKTIIFLAVILITFILGGVLI